MDNWLPKHVTQILVHYMSEARVRWWGKNMSLHSFAATRHNSYLETKWTAGMRSNSYICTYYWTEICVTFFMIYAHTSTHECWNHHVSQGQMHFGKGHKDAFEFRWALSPLHWSPALRDKTTFLCWRLQHKVAEWAPFFYFEHLR